MTSNYRYTISYENIDASKTLTGNTDIAIKKLSKVNIFDNVSPSSSSIQLPGSYFVFPDYENFYFHTMRDYIAQYELIKQYVPDLKPLVLCSCGKNDELDKPKSCVGSNPKTSPEFFVLHQYKDDISIVDCTPLNNVEIESLYFIYVNGPDVFTQLVGEYSYDKVVLETDNSYWMEDLFSRTLRDRYKEYLKPTDYSKKIYVSRKKESAQTWKISDAWDIYTTNGDLPKDDALKLTIKNIAKALPQALDELEMKKSRAYSVEDEILLEKYFESKGYQIVSPGDLSVEQQISLFSSSGHVVGAGGSGMTNILFCNPDATITLISAGSRFNFGGHTSLARALNKRCNFFPEKVIVDHDADSYVKFSAKEIIDLIDKSGVQI